MGKYSFRILFILLITNLLCINVKAQETLTLTLDQALEIALSESNTIKIADKTVEKSGYAQKGSYSALYPNVSVSGSYQRTLLKQVMVMDMGGQAMEIKVGRDNNINTSASASMPLVNAQLWESLKLSALDVEMAVEQARSSKVSMVSQVKQAFYGVLLAKASLDVVSEMYKNAQANYEKTLQRYQVGKASELEKLRAEVNVKNAEPNVSSSENAVLLATWQLKAVMGLDLATEIDVVGDIMDYTNELLTPYVSEDDISNNSSLLQLDIQDRMLESTLRMQRKQYLPSLAATINFNYNAMGDDKLSWFPSSVAAVSLNIPVFDGFQKHYNIKQSKVAKDMLSLQREDAERQIRIAIRNYNDRIALCVKNYTAASSTVSIAQKSYEISQKMYEVGKTTLVELNDAQLALQQAQLTQAQAVYDFMVAKAALNELIGKE
ncbi:MAG: TolC family protein [Bacteroidales bacterium]|jgi:outer membrane protein TolC|nr:TolC family protein [Bacteroidales bacterium]